MNTKNRRDRSSFKSSSRRTYTRQRPSRDSRRGYTQRRPSGRRGGRVMPTFNPSQFINTTPIDNAPEIYTPKHRFDTLGLDGRLVRSIAASGISTPTPIQDQIIPEILNGRDVIGLAETGTGKTAAFLIPLIDQTLRDNTKQTLILTPTRELAIQVQDELQTLTKGMRIFSVTCVGGVNIRPQINALRRPQHFIIGTPGRVLDLIKRKSMSPAQINTVVLDEADRMLDMGFIHDIRKILSTTPKSRETLFFSATFNVQVKKLASEFINDPITVSVKKREVTNSIEQSVVFFKHDEKFNTLLSLLRNPDMKCVLIFGSMKHSVQKLAQQLSENQIRSDAIHGNKSHGQRQQALKRFKEGRVRVLVATDVAARGIHVDNVSHVINYDLPSTFEDYVHRIGRTGRGSKRGKALTFVPQRG